MKHLLLSLALLLSTAAGFGIAPTPEPPACDACPPGYVATNDCRCIIPGCGTDGGAFPKVLVTRSIALNATPAQVWALVGGFQSLPDWHPSIASSAKGTVGEVETRRLALEGDGGEILENNLGSDTMSMSYEIVDPGPLPVANYKAILSVVDVGGKAVFVWSSTFEDTSAEGAGAAAIVGFYEDGIAALAAKFP